MVGEALDFRYLLIENYKKLKLTEVELATLFIIDHFIEQGNPMITADLLSLKMTMPVKDIDKVLADLLRKKMIDYIEDNKKVVTTLEPLKKLLYREFEISLNNENLLRKKEKYEEDINNIYKKFQDYLGRNLSPIEFSRIKEWLTFGYSEEIILDALKEAISKNKKSLRSVDKILLNWSKRDDLEKEGHSVIDEDWHKNIEETIKIAQTPWVNIDDEKDK